MSETVTQTETDQRPATARSLGAEEKEAKSDEQFQQERTIKGFRWFIVIISILSSVTLYSLDNTIVADIQPQIINTFDELDKLPWLSVAFLVACIVGGGFAVSKVGWRWSFYINLFFAAVAIPIYLFMLPSFDPRPGVSYKERLAQLDYLGTILMIGACVSGVMAINFGGQIYPWDSGQTISCFVVSGVLFIVFGLQQWYCIGTTKENRTFPCQFLARPAFIILFVQTASVATVFFVPIYFVPLFFQFTRNDSAIDAGVRLLPLVCFIVAAMILNGALMSKFGYYMPWYLVGGCLSLVGSVLMYTIKLGTSTANIYGYMIILGVGGGMYAQASFAVAQGKARPREIPVATGFISLAQLTGGTIALAIANSVFLEKASAGIMAVVPDASKETVQSAISGASSSFFQTLDPDVREAVLAAVTHAISQVYILPITGAAMSISLAIFMPREKLFVASDTGDRDGVTPLGAMG
ncbi:hypothetical protein ATERTT37_004690 [Aspergillus terreus]